MIDAKLLDILVCPITKSRLRHEQSEQGEFLIAETGGLRYPIRDGIPVMLVNEARLPAGVASLDEFKKKYAPCIPS